MTEAHAFLHVCITCRADAETVENQDLPGSVLHRRLEGLLADRPGLPVRVLPARCLSNCQHGCAAAIAMDGKWSYLLGGLDLDRASDLLEFAGIYAASKTGVVMPSKRPASLAAMVDGRIPALPASPMPILETSQP